jgi:hypothetical protein
MAFTPWLNYIKQSYQSARGLDWDGEIKDLRKKVGKDDFPKGVAELFERICKNAAEAYQHSGDVSAGRNLENLLENVATIMKSQQLKEQVENLKAMEESDAKQAILAEMFKRPEIIRFLSAKLEEVLKNEDALRQDVRIKKLVEAKNKMLTEQSTRSKDASYSLEDRVVINALELFYMFLEIIADKLNLNKIHIEHDPNEEENKGKVRYLPQIAPPPRPAPH